MRIAAFGDINVDVILTVDRLPRRGEEVFSTDRSEMLGGSAANTAAVLSRLGHQVTVMGAVGSDTSGTLALTTLENIGVSCGFASQLPELATAMNTILITPDGERTMVGARGASVAYRNVPGWESGIDWLHISGYALMEGAQQKSALEAIRIASGLGIKMSMDVPNEVGTRVRDIVAGHLGSFTIVAGNEGSLREVTGSDHPVEKLMEIGVSMVAITSGGDPLVLANGANRISLTPPRVNPIDATGAGDAFIAGLIAATLGDVEIGPSAVLGAACGAAATLVVGASRTLDDPGIWDHLLRPELWSDAEPGWLRQVSDLVRGDTLSLDPE